MERTVKQGLVCVLAVMGFGLAMAVRDELSSVPMRALLGGVAGSYIGIAVHHAQQRSGSSLRRQRLERTLRLGVVTVLAVIGFAVAMTEREEPSSVPARVLLAAVGGSFLVIAWSQSHRR